MSKLVDISEDFFAGSQVAIGTIAIADGLNPTEDVDLTGSIARLTVGWPGVGTLLTIDSDDPGEHAGVLDYTPAEDVLTITITPALNALLPTGRTDVLLWIVFDPEENPTPVELASGIWTKKAAP